MWTGSTKQDAALVLMKATIAISDNLESFAGSTKQNFSRLCVGFNVNYSNWWGDPSIVNRIWTRCTDVKLLRTETSRCTPREWRCARPAQGSFLKSRGPMRPWSSSWVLFPASSVNSQVVHRCWPCICSCLLSSCYLETERNTAFHNRWI